MRSNQIQEIYQWHQKNKKSALYGRWIPFSKIEPILSKFTAPFKVKQLGKSYKGLPIHSIEIGTGLTKVLIWSQMHGNESTGTKAMFDICAFFESPGAHKKLTDDILKKCTICYIPILNPDGAAQYSRLNAQDIDLNRDAVAKKAPESKVLHRVLKNFDPDYCFNLHDQRTIFSVAPKNLPATISFLAPSVDEERSLTQGRKTTMALVSEMHKALRLLIPDQIGRYTDEFYPTATGDTFQKAGYPTVLIEAGHFKDDYQREQVRSYNFIALLAGLEAIGKGLDSKQYKDYFDIPDNQKGHLDLIYKNILLKDTNQKVDVGVVFKEKLIAGDIAFSEELYEFGDLTFFNANVTIDKTGQIYSNSNDLRKTINKKG